MPREAAPSVNERAFVLRALAQGVRLDGRAPDAIRWPTLTFGSEYGSVEVRMGKTRVQANVSIETTSPYADRKFDGIFTIAAELSPMASPAFENGRPNDLESLLSRFLEKSLRRSAALDTESLCLIAGRLCFQLTLTLHVLALDGGLFDASLCAATAALAHARLPASHVAGADVRVFSAAERVPQPLALHHRPYSVSWTCLVEEADATGGGGGGGADGQGGAARMWWVADATQLEAQVGSAEMVVAANREGEIVQAAKLGGAPADAVDVLERAEATVRAVKEIGRRVDEALAKDAARREGGEDASAENER